ncbi:endopeptidase La [Aliikangiella coralliicola]|uniref:Lon protease n=1 Tax=Aliikangiella coralliicola TaxID=2592383 RepID=A0A545U8I9_9GAMM|nr:endopeptidase La [Aliikangiella coralliicola]TQV85782.1 endopeptidase La [Aliikangiella coralliicola]
MENHDKQITKIRDGEKSVKYLPSEVCLLPISERPFFPPQTLPILMNEESWRDTIEFISEKHKNITGLVLVKNPLPEDAKPEEFFKVGTLVKIHHPVLSSGKVQFIAEGLQRFRIKKWIDRTPPFIVQVEYPHEPEYTESDELKAYAIAIINTLKEMVPLNPLYSEELKFFLNRFDPNEPSQLTDFAASVTTATRNELQRVLETVHLKRRMEKVLVLIKKELEVARLQKDIHDQVEETLSEHQRRFFLKEQLKAIQKELGIAKDDKTADLERFEKNISDKLLPKLAREKFYEEFNKLSILESGSPEYAVTRNYLEVFSKLPWGIFTEDNLKLRSAKLALDREHAGLKDVKQRIIEFLALGALKGEISGSILLLVGPPGVGKTSVGRSIAAALKREFFRFSVGGMRDEAEIKGHRRTYIGAMPGKIVQALIESGSSNPVIMLDEIDKIGSSYQGDPSSALLEVLDPEQNNQFLDHYLDTRVDLSKVLFICTANQLDTIPRPLLDRMEVIRLSGYILEEKIEIAKQHLWPKQIQRSGIAPSKIKLTDSALKALIDGYAREAGVRNLDKLLAKIIRKCAVSIVNEHVKKISISKNNLTNFLGMPLFSRDSLITGVGICTGLAWTSLGGVTLSIEAAKIHGSSRGFKLTGQLGNVMKESADIAYSYIAAHLARYGVDEKALDKQYVHLHVPEGATPKDGPSAGITMASALLSLVLKKKVRSKFAMTGELTLSGSVLAVGGIREKVIAAKREGINNIILPKAVEGRYEKLPKHIQKGLKVHFVGHYDQVFELLF